MAKRDLEQLTKEKGLKNYIQKNPNPKLSKESKIMFKKKQVNHLDMS